MDPGRASSASSIAPPHPTAAILAEGALPAAAHKLVGDLADTPYGDLLRVRLGKDER